MNLKVMPLKVQNKQSFMGMNFSNPQERARYIAQRQIETVVRAQQADAFIKNNAKNNNQTASSIADSSSRSISFTSDPYPTVWPSLSSGESEDEKKQREEREAFEKLETTDPLKWAQTWDYNKRKARYDELYKEELSGYFFESLHKKKVRTKYDSLFVREHEKVTNILQTLKSVQDKVDTAQLKEDAAKAQARANELVKKELELTKRLEDRINSRLNNPDANINQSIAGYMYQKGAIRDMFLAPVDLEKEYFNLYNDKLKSPELYSQEDINETKQKALNVPIPPSVLFYGCFGTGKTTFARAIAAEAGCYAEEFNPASEPYDKFVDRALTEARQRYLNEGKRTIIIINEIEEYLNGNADTDTRKRVARMKSTLDNCSKTPFHPGIDGASAATFFFTTNFPKDLMNIGILGRAGKMPLVVPVEPAVGDDLKEVLKFHIKRVMPQESSFDVENYDFTPILDKIDPTRQEDSKEEKQKGFYSNDRIRAAMDEVRTAYDKNPEKSFKTHLEEMILDEKSRKLKLRDISPELYKQYYDDYEMIGEG